LKLETFDFNLHTNSRTFPQNYALYLLQPPNFSLALANLAGKMLAPAICFSHYLSFLSAWWRHLIYDGLSLCVYTPSLPALFHLLSAMLLYFFNKNFHHHFLSPFTWLNTQFCATNLAI